MQGRPARNRGLGEAKTKGPPALLTLQVGHGDGIKARKSLSHEFFRAALGSPHASPYPVVGRSQTPARSQARKALPGQLSSSRKPKVSPEQAQSGARLHVTPSASKGQVCKQT